MLNNHNYFIALVFKMGKNEKKIHCILFWMRFIIQGFTLRSILLSKNFYALDLSNLMLKGKKSKKS